MLIISWPCSVAGLSEGLEASNCSTASSSSSVLSRSHAGEWKKSEIDVTGRGEVWPGGTGVACTAVGNKPEQVLPSGGKVSSTNALQQQDEGGSGTD